MNAQRPILRLTAAAICLAALALPVAAETIGELEGLSRSSASPASGIALARRQIGSGDLLDALATLERVLINHPQARDAQLLRASVMCQLDDRAGSTAEFDQLKGRGIPERAFRDAVSACDALSARRRAS